MLWHHRFELENPGNLCPELHAINMRCIYGRALCCHRHNAEVWLSYARYESQLVNLWDGSSSTGTSPEATKRSKALLQEAIECNSGVSILRIALAELEETNSNPTVARETLRSAFVENPNPFTFSVLQRHIRRLEGKTAARLFFSETMPARLDGILNFEVSL